jgi:hypothetical protein
VLSLRPEIRLLHEVLEGAMTRPVAARLVFEALGDCRVPESIDDLLAFAQGPLAIRLVAYLGATPAEEMTTRLVRLLERRKRTGSFSDLEITLAPDDETAPTRAVAVAVDDPVPVMVVGGTYELSLLLDVVLGDDFASVTPCRDAAEIRRLTFAELPFVVVVDGESPPDDPIGVAGALADMPASVVRVIWAADAPAAAPVARALVARGGYAVQVSRSDGIDPLLDLLKSRRRVSGAPTPPE